MLDLIEPVRRTQDHETALVFPGDRPRDHPVRELGIDIRRQDGAEGPEDGPGLGDQGKVQRTVGDLGQDLPQPLESGELLLTGLEGGDQGVGLPPPGADTGQAALQCHGGGFHQGPTPQGSAVPVTSIALGPSAILRQPRR